VQVTGETLALLSHRHVGQLGPRLVELVVARPQIAQQDHQQTDADRARAVAEALPGRTTADHAGAAGHQREHDDRLKTRVRRPQQGHAGRAVGEEKAPAGTITDRQRQGERDEDTAQGQRQRAPARSERRQHHPHVAGDEQRRRRDREILSSAEPLLVTALTSGKTMNASQISAASVLRRPGRGPAIHPPRRPAIIRSSTLSPARGAGAPAPVSPVTPPRPGGCAGSAASAPPRSPSRSPVSAGRWR